MTTFVMNTIGLIPQNWSEIFYSIQYIYKAINLLHIFSKRSKVKYVKNSDLLSDPQMHFYTQQQSRLHCYMGYSKVFSPENLVSNIQVKVVRDQKMTTALRHMHRVQICIL